MEVAFASNSLRRCYETHAEAVREWGSTVARKYIQRVNVLYAAREFADLYTIKSLRVHKLKGDLEGQYAITIHDRWRLLLSRLADDRVRIEEVTKHYGD